VIDSSFFTRVSLTLTGLKHARSVQAKRSWRVHQNDDESDLPDALRREFAAAFKDYCATLTRLSDEVACGEELSLDHRDQIEAAKLRLENAWTLCELYVGSGMYQPNLNGTPAAADLRLRA
jgi:hypothetical protein